ncbi:putative MFS monocarboxylate transporter [Emericellopsis atlantica]|uniref:MFS monocarboxylate transporter n=1 Tax=Emericellopsis atlantica TaxID=2614577 RepID=A0A9P7ZVM1_9HYPO|nr:putative MFS monocarboxylate transporter [Emericellopsis atlantica]KAG9258651.1 putative MFS monocarboxylate transporter [Emericellopsis atlantica]
MDVRQVTSRTAHDGPEDEIVVPDEQPPEGTDLEKRATHASSTASYQETYPEGGTKAWLVVLGAWFSMFSSLGLMNTIGIFQAYTLDHQLKGQSEGTVGWVFSIYTFLAFFCGVYIGPIFDKHGPRYLILAGSVLTVGGMLSTSFCTELWHFIIAFGILCGVGTSLLFTPSVGAVGHWFKARRGLATGIAATAGGFGGIIFPLMANPLFEQIGFGWTARCIALIVLVSCIMGNLLVRSRLPPAPNATAKPEFKIFKHVTFTLATVGLFLLEFSLFIPVGYITTYALHKGFDPTFAYQLIPILNAGSVVGRGLPGWYADIIGPFNTCISSVVLSLFACLVIWLPFGHTTPGIVMFALLFGFASGTGIAIAPVCIGRLCKTQEYGRYYATTYTVVSFACLIGIPIAGSVVQANDGEYWGLIILTGTVYVGSLAAFVWAKATVVGWRNWTAVF